jgi:hypothetical protein
MYLRMIEIVKYSKNYKNQWNEFLLDGKNSTFLFNRDFIDYHSDRFNDYSLIILDEDKIAGLLPANIDDDGIAYSHQGLTYGGFVFCKDEKLNNILIYLHSAIKFLSENGIDKLKYKSFPRFYNTIGADEVDYSLFLLNARLYRRDTASVINLNDKIEYQNRRIRAIKKAKQLGVIILEKYSFSEFWNEILIPNLNERFGVNPVHSQVEIELLAKHFPTNIRQFNAYLNDKIVAGTTIFETSIVAHAQYISATNEGRNNGGLDLLFSHLIESQFNDKNYFDFGISNENQGKSLNHGLLDWKEGFGGRTFSHDFYEIETNKYALLEKSIKW